MIQSILVFLLGFLSAAFLAALIAPAVWRRAVALTRKRIEASAPLSLPELQADKDRLRAEFAMSTRRLEMNVKSEREKVHARLLEINESREELKKRIAEHEERQMLLTRVEEKSIALQAKLDEREGQVRMLSDKLHETQRTIEIRNADIEKLNRLYEEASFASSSRQIELVARESEIEKLGADVATLRVASRKADDRHREIAAESRLAQDALKDEKKRYADLEKKYQRTQSSLIQHEERLARRDQELARLRDKLKIPQPTEIVMADPEPATPTDPDSAMKRLSAERDRLVERLTTLTRENRKLTGGDKLAEDQDTESAVLRDQIGNLAAEVVRQTAQFDGPDSPINKALGTATAGQKTPDGPISLADKIRALQKVQAPT